MGGVSRSAFQVGSGHVIAVALLTLSVFGVYYISTGAGTIANSSPECSDLVMLFARGSSSNPQGLNLNNPFSKEFEKGIPDPNNPAKTIGAEEVPGAFFRWMETRIKADYKHIDYKAMSIHNSARGWSIQGYPAVGIFSGSGINNMFDAELSWYPAGQYRGSVDSGAHELAGQVNYETERCPNQRIVVGGYSQGAHVVHEALKLIPENQRNVIDDVVLFGDPKFIGAEYNKYNLLDTPKAYPWHRGTADLRERGLADAEIPYVPDDMKYKTISWCHEDDFVCTGLSGLSWALTNHELPSNDNSFWKSPSAALGDGHTRYPEFGIPEATEEIMSNLKPYLAALEVSRGGIDPKVDPSRKIYDGTLVNNRPIDLMFAFNKTGGIDDAFYQYSFNLQNIINQDKSNFTNITTGSVMYTDMAGGSGVNQSYVAAYTQVPNQLSTKTSNMFNWSPYIYGGLGGGGDYPENHGMAIERASMQASWRSGAIKHIVLFAERPATEQWSFNMCDSMTASQLPINLPTRCLPGSTFSATSQSVYCESVLLVTLGSQCSLPNGSTQPHIIARNLAEEVKLARSKGFVVDIIQPHEARTGIQGWEPQKVSAQLKNLAESTGGLYLKYGTFDEPAMRDAIWQILNHQPRLMDVRTYLPGTNLNFLEGKALTQPLQPVLELAQGAYSQLTVAPVIGARSYGWDYDSNGVIDVLSEGPAAGFSPQTPMGSSSFASVTAYSGSSGTSSVLATTYVPYTVVTSSAGPVYAPIAGDGLAELTIARDSNGGADIAWSTGGLRAQDLVIIIDPLSGLPLSSIPALQGVYHLSDVVAGRIVELRLISTGTESDIQQVTVPMLPEIPLPVVVPEAPLQPTGDPQPGMDETLQPQVPPIQDTADPQQDMSPDTAPTENTQPTNQPDIQAPSDQSIPGTIVSPVEVPTTDAPIDTESPGNAIDVPDTPPPTPVVTVDATPSPEPALEVPVSAPKEPTVDVGPTQGPATVGIGSSSPAAIPVVVNGPAVSREAEQSSATYVQQTPAPQTTEPDAITVVAGEQDVKTNPQGEVGGVNEVNQLLKGENVGKQPKAEQGSGISWLLIIGISIGVLVFILLGVFVLKRSDDES